MKTQFPVKIRNAGLQDLVAINRVIGYAVANSPIDNRKKRDLVPSLLFSTDLFGQHTLLVAERRGEIIGIIALRQTGPNTAATIESLYVLPIIQHQGIGGLLVGAARNLLRGQDWHVSSDSAAHQHLQRATFGNLVPANDAADSGMTDAA